MHSHDASALQPRDAYRIPRDPHNDVRFVRPDGAGGQTGPDQHKETSLEEYTSFLLREARA